MSATLPANRLASLDAFRGLTIAAMILVNNPGNWGYVYAPLRHAQWHGWTPTDMIFPFFLFIMGVAMALTFQRHQGEHNRIWIILRRSLVLFLLGLILNVFPTFDMTDVRILGVLQRIAICYLIVAMMVLVVGRQVYRHLIVGGLLAVYLYAMYGYAGPQFNPGDLTPEGNAGATFDQLILGMQHLYRDGPFDPEGLLTTLPAILSTYLGYLFGMVLVKEESHTNRMKKWAIYGAGLLVAGQLLSFIIPINKALWTPSYALLMAGFGGLFLLGCYWLIEVKGIKSWAGPFVILGMNPLFIFWMSGFLVRVLALIKIETADGLRPVWTLLYQHGFASWLPSYPASLAFAMANVVFWLLVAWVMFRQRWFIKI